MKRIPNKTIFAAMLALALAPIISARAEDNTLPAEAAKSVTAFKTADAGLNKFFENSAGYAILPTVGQGALVVGGEHGHGLVYAKGKLVGKATLNEVTVGAQVGGGSFSEIIFFETADALKSFMASNWSMDAKASATVAASGSASNAKYMQGVAVFTLPKSGAMLQAAVGGQKFKFEPLK